MQCQYKSDIRFGNEADFASGVKRAFVGKEKARVAKIADK
jgi:hypothetical protein